MARKKTFLLNNFMEIKFEKGPSTELIDGYCKKIEHFLSPIGAKLRIEVNDIGPLGEFRIDGVLTARERYWLGDFIVTTPSGEFKLRQKPRFGIDSDIDDNELWRDAAMIQDQIYNQFKLERGNPFEKTPYWSLWEKLPK